MQVLEFFKGKRGGIIACLPSGKVALVNRRSKRKPKEGEKWLCKIDFEKPTFAVVTPIERIVKVKKPITEHLICPKCSREISEHTWYEEVEVRESESSNISPEHIYTEFYTECDQCKLEKCKELIKVFNRKLKQYIDIFKEIPPAPEIKIRKEEYDSHWVFDDPQEAKRFAKQVNGQIEPIYTWDDEGYSCMAFRVNFKNERYIFENEDEVLEWINSLTDEQKTAIAWLDFYMDVDYEKFIEEGDAYIFDELRLAVDDKCIGGIAQTVVHITEEYERPKRLAEAYHRVRKKLGLI